MEFRDAIKMLSDKIENISCLGETPALYKDGVTVAVGTTTILEKHVSTGWVFTGESL